MKLQSSEDFGKTLISETDSEYRRKRDLYDKFIEQSLELEMLVPCSDNGNVLEEPLNYNQWCKKALNTSYDLDLSKYEQYEQAKEKVLFEGFTLEGNTVYLEGWSFCKTNEISESNIKWILFNMAELDEVKLTQNATKQFL